MLNLRLILLAAAVAASVLAGGVAAADQPRSGEAIFKELCAKCHGAAGEGNAEHDTGPLSGDRSLAELAELIDKTMPEDAPEKCVGDDAKAVAAYVYDTFYSPIARARIQPARIELSRLTVRQYQNAVSDLIGSFRDESRWDGQRGLKGEYFKGRRTRRSERVIERIDPTIRFDWADSSPDPEKFEPHEFSIEWEGSVLAPETGEYEFIVRTEHAARLWINDLETPLIDAWVKSGSDTEYRGTIRLLGGRAYALKLDFSKAKQGVNDRNKEKEKPPPAKASLALLWKLPHRPAEVIPERCLSPLSQPERFVVTAPFPPDDRSVGYERGTAISKAWDEAATEGAIETAGYVAEHLRELSGASEDAGDERSAKLREFCYRFAERAFRRPLTDEQRRMFVDHQFEEAAQPELAVKRVVLLALKSPRFLYREVGSDSPDAYDTASRISFGLWDSLPDRPLLEAAAAGQLATREQVAAQVERMLPDLRTRAKLRQFFQQWLKVEQVPDLAKDSERYPNFNADVANDLRTALDLFVDEVVWSEASDFRQLLLADALPLNGRLAKFYGEEVPEDAPFEKRPLEPEHRAGLLTHPYLLTTFAYTGTSSPIHRGVFISRSLLGRALKPPPEAVAPLAPDSHANLTTRERIALQTNSKACLSCHAMINPLGFTLEHFDAVGRFRAEETGKPIDASGEYLTRSGERKQFRGVRELAAFLAESEETHAAFVQQLFHHLIKQPIRAYGPEMSIDLRKSFRENQFSIRKLAAEIVTTSALSSLPQP